MNKPQLDRDVTVNRNQGLGASDAKWIMDGKWRELFRLKTGRAQPEDLSRVFRVQLGIHTEAFHAAWAAREMGLTLVEPQPFYLHPDSPHLFCHLDGWIRENETFIEVKHTNGQNTHRACADYYMPQLAHICHVVGVSEGWFSAICGNDDPECRLVEPAPEFIKQLVDLENQFWWHVTKDEEPDALDVPVTLLGKAKDAAASSLVGGLRPYKMDGNNAWAAEAASIIVNKEAAAAYDKATKAIKDLVPADASECVGHGVQIKRDKAGRLRIYT